ncbi:glycosyltransferase [Paraburkholderia caballeronis]|uniref:Glycosyltransferase involved in cell wall bisynthesis n=1 Tax=Paraburkholderia caballeronis TaxID=416943 RepID=A0A1H7S1R8_9BURK|nr:glycosyltransferase [Paraburkholderia caballeronis]PXW22827.1 glycosyltransferase involved in cell wall biosynthesis [Paraburkholderia caballeronis]PXW97212.1 glycosyltransferase involved in cell wall biosynthesis [Paraburkholderia caballeronis]RAJ93732.1 glycosyltransferase involved in cell wall biosynthesis [Paraburkholderia caballeronis]TDV14006.1 glycosyltransferase involved in cell wall biosynthesis [Paraburkholderia caballeronis]TDV15519.1 glycosyltransferase involved in cell wall bio
MTATQVHVHLFYGADPRHYRKGEDIGCLYGYHHAESDEFALNYSRDAAESRPVRFVRRALKAALGFDFVHTWRNRRAILAADAVWTHTEQEHLAVSLLLLMNARRRGRRPLLLAQSVWLLDRWPGYGPLRRALYRRLLARADLLTTLASENAALCGRYFGRAARHVFYGLNTNDFPLRPPSQWQPHTPLRVAAIGNDRDRDWTTLATALGHDARYAVRIATRRRIPASVRAPNVEIVRVSGIDEQHALYEWADLIVVPLRPNTHASGITVMLEAAALGKPMVATRVGALDDYFDDDAVSYVEPFDPAQLRAAVNALLDAPSRALRQAQAACGQLRERDLTTQHFARQHAQLTREMLNQRDAGAGVGADLDAAPLSPDAVRNASGQWPGRM